MKDLYRILSSPAPAMPLVGLAANMATKIASIQLGDVSNQERVLIYSTLILYARLSWSAPRKDSQFMSTIILFVLHALLGCIMAKLTRVTHIEMAGIALAIVICTPPYFRHWRAFLSDTN